MAEARSVVERLVAAGEIVYGVTTGFGDLATTVIDPADSARLQENHGSGLESGMMLLQYTAAALASVFDRSFPTSIPTASRRPTSRPRSGSSEKGPWST
jgi:histidine ammonia-lyase